MRKILKFAKYTLLLLIALFVAAIGSLLALRTYRQHVNTQALAIHSPNGIDEGMYVRVGGIEQWIQIRGQDRNDPVLLCLHGGPGGTWIPMTALFVPWEKQFTVVQWDQRGAGKTLETTGDAVAATMSIDRMAQDGVEIAEFLCHHLHKDKIILLGHSWGSILGIHMAKRRPDLFYAYVGTGQVSDMQTSQQMSYAHLLEQAREANDKKAVRQLENAGPPPFDRMEKAMVYFSHIQDYQPATDQAALSSPVGSLTSPPPGYSLRDTYYRLRGFAVVPTWSVYHEMLNTNLASLGFDFKIPIFFFQGTEDELTLAPLAQEYFEKIDAPHKEMVLFEGGGHFAVWSMPDRFLQELVKRVRPLARPHAVRAATIGSAIPMASILWLPKSPSFTTVRFASKANLRSKTPAARRSAWPAVP